MAAVIAEADTHGRRSNVHRGTINHHRRGRGINDWGGRSVNDSGRCGVNHCRLSRGRVRVCVTVSRCGITYRGGRRIISWARSQSRTNDKPGRHASQNLSRRGPSAIAGGTSTTTARGGGLNTCSGNSQSRERQNNLFHNLPSSLQSKLHEYDGPNQVLFNASYPQY